MFMPMNIKNLISTNSALTHLILAMLLGRHLHAGLGVLASRISGRVSVLGLTLSF